MTVRKHIYGLVGLSGHPSGGHGQRCHGVAHERHQNAQKWPPLWAPPSTHIYEEKKMKKNEKNPDFLRGTNAVTFQLSNHDKKWCCGVVGSPMGVHKCGVKYGNFTVVTSHSDGEREEAQMVSSHFIVIKVPSRTSVVTVQARKLLRWGQGVAHGGAQLRQKSIGNQSLTLDVVTAP